MKIEEIRLNQRVYCYYKGRKLECRVLRIIKGPPLDAVRVVNGDSGEIVAGPNDLRDAAMVDQEVKDAKKDEAREATLTAVMLWKDGTTKSKDIAARLLITPRAAAGLIRTAKHWGFIVDTVATPAVEPAHAGQDSGRVHGPGDDATSEACRPQGA
jgi:hypothetical protein